MIPPPIDPQQQALNQLTMLLPKEQQAMIQSLVSQQGSGINQQELIEAIA